MNVKTTIVLLCVALVVGGFLVYDKVQLKSTDELEALSEKVLDINSDDVQKIRLVHGDVDVVVERDGEKWRMLQPLEVPADAGAANGIASRFEFLKREQTVEAAEGLDPATYGLTEPRITLTVSTEDEEHVVRIGSDTAVGSQVYLQVEGRDDIYAVAQSVYTLLDKSVDDLRDKSVVNYDNDALAKLEVRTPDLSIVAERKGDVWRLVSPVSGRASKDAIDKMLNGLKYLRIEGYPSEEPGDLPKYGLQPPALSVTVYEGTEMVARTVDLGRADPGDGEKVYGRNRAYNSIYQVKDSTLDDLTPDLSTLRDKHMMSFEAFDAESLTITRGSTAVGLVKSEDGKWSLTAPQEMDADAGAVTDYLRQLGEVEAVDFVAETVGDPAAYGLDKPQAQFSVKVKDVEEPLMLTVGKLDLDAGKLYAQAAGDEAVAALPTDFLAQMPANPLAFMDRLVLKFAKPDVIKAEVAYGDRREVAEKEGEGWRLVEPADEEASSGSVDDVLWDLSYLRANKIVGEAADGLGQYGLDAPAIRAGITVRPEGGEEEAYVLLVGETAADNSYYAMLEDGDYVFTLPGYKVDRLKQSWVEGAPPALPPGAPPMPPAPPGGVGAGPSAPPPAPGG